jgi:hypothetical protein
MTFVSSYDRQEAFRVVIQADLDFAGWAPVPARVIEDAPRPSAPSP